MFFGWLFLASFAASAKDKGPLPVDVLKKGLDSTDVWSHGPLMITAKVRFLQMRDGPTDMDYALSWEASDRWRSEWQGAGISEVHAANGAQTWAKSNLQAPAFADAAV